VHAALAVATKIDDPDAMVATILPDGGRAYLSKIFNDAWMSQYGFLERSADRTVGDVLFAKTTAGEIPPFVTVQTHQKVKDAISLLHEHRAPPPPPSRPPPAPPRRGVGGGGGGWGPPSGPPNAPELMSIEIVD